MRPLRSEGVTHSGRLTDGILSNDGDEWLTNLTSRLSPRASFVEYDLGKAQAVRCALVQADGNDVGLLSGSLDGQTWQLLWRVGAGETPGMFLRSARLDATVRYLRLSVNGDDAIHGVGEIAAYSECPEPWPTELSREHGTPASESIDTNILLFGLLVGLFVLVHRGPGSKLQYFLLAPAIVVGWKLIGEEEATILRRGACRIQRTNSCLPSYLMPLLHCAYGLVCLRSLVVQKEAAVDGKLAGKPTAGASRVPRCCSLCRYTGCSAIGDVRFFRLLGHAAA
jgi:hypothetical protein